MESALGALCTALSVSIVWPQVWRLRGGRKVDGISAITMTMVVSGSLGLLAYGWLKPVWSLAISMLFVGAGQFYVATRLVKQKKLPVSYLAAAIAATVLLTVISAFTDPTIIGSVAGFLMVANLVPQTIAVLRTKDPTGISVLSFSLLTVAMVCWCIYAVVIGDWVVFFSDLFIIPFSSAIVAKTVLSRRKDHVLLAG